MRDEVKRVVEPLQKRNDDRIDKVETELKELRNLLAKGAPSSLSHAINHSGTQHVVPTQTNKLTEGGDLSTELLALLTKARKTISLKPISKEDVDLQFRIKQNVISEQQALREACD